eukprot:TRINITY_DN5741_c0_g1_i5.p1 TRINITY_DN5741_c0_g1~~TRINITY_DN5741_c0_g1_i5.p1  ORF type:complete len:528 (+),score=101.91 TRINITY_DN5741_c0_g1_i5:24-1607(+)
MSQEQRVEVAWNEAADDLKKEVWDWSDNNIADTKDWIHELGKQKIRSCKTLMAWADDDDDFSALRAAVSTDLRVSLRLWFKRTYPGRVLPSAPKQARGSEEQEKPFEDLQKDMPAPSSFSNYRNKGCWVDFVREHPDKIICHRDKNEKFSIPVCLMNPVFAQFVHDLDHIAVFSQDCVFVDSLTDSMCGAFKNEKERMYKFFELFQEYTGWKLLVLQYDGSETDGSLHFVNGALYCNLEVKAEKGSGGGDPYMQCIAHYIKSLPVDAVSTQYPCFLLELCGTAFSVSGILNTERQIICEPLSPTYQLLCHQDFVFAGKIARLFASLRKNLEVLRLKESTGFLRSSSFPYLSSFRDLSSNSMFNIQYRERMKGLLFCAQVLDTEVQVIVKFCSRYNQDVHRFCHSLGFAPALISICSLGHYVVVVMEKLTLRALSPDDFTKSQIRDQINFIFHKLKEKSYVHGDMRRTNILLDTLANRVVLVDFDWAGIDGIDVYPPFMNPDINWPEGASTGKPLRHEHDLYWLNDLC